jgi:hypothetical protein
MEIAFAYRSSLGEGKMKTVAELKSEILRLEEELGRVEGTKTEVYTRIVGYYRSVKNWNKGKREEYRLRDTFAVPCFTPIAGELRGKGTAQPEAAKPAARTPEAGLKPAVPLPQGLSWMLFTRKTCAKCPPVKDYIGRLPMKGALVDVDSEEGLEEARKYSVISAPTAVFLDGTGNEVFRAHAIEEIASKMGAVRV